MKLGVLALPTSWYWRDLQRAATPDDTLVSLTFSTLSAQVAATANVSTAESSDLGALDALLVRTMPPGTLEQVIFRMNTLHRLQAEGLRVVNSARTLEIAVDKYLATAELQAAGLPVPRTCVSQTWEDAMRDFESLGGDVVIKPIFGAEGRGITRLNDEAIAWRVFKTYDQLGHLIYLQEFLPHGNVDYRVLILGSQMYGMKRSNPHDWRTNVSLGAVAEPIDVTNEMADLSWRAASAIGAQFVGVDLLRADDGRLFVIEVNAVPGWRGLSRALGVDIAHELLNWLKQ